MSRQIDHSTKTEFALICNEIGLGTCAINIFQYFIHLQGQHARVTGQDATIRTISLNYSCLELELTATYFNKLMTLTSYNKRIHPRIEPINLAAQIKITHPPSKEFLTEGIVLDISYSGIKIKLNTPIQAKKGDNITINLQLPKSGIPISIRGVIKHQLSDKECGIYFSDQPPEEYMDDLMFECIKHSH